MLKKGNDFLHDEPSPVLKSLEISENYESLFTKNYSNSLHLPRIQLVFLNNLLESEDYVPPRLIDVRVIYGEPIIPSRPESQRIRKIDYNHLIKTRETLNKLPMNLIDRSGLDYWVMVRRINWQVSPAPIRLLTQISDVDPTEIWSWNRTAIIDELENHNLNEIVNHYKLFYLTGWKAFLTQYQDNKNFRQLIYHGYKVLHLSTQIL
jgi:hypothetical protein